MYIGRTSTISEQLIGLFVNAPIRKLNSTELPFQAGCSPDRAIDWHLLRTPPHSNSQYIPEYQSTTKKQCLSYLEKIDAGAVSTLRGRGGGGEGGGNRLPLSFMAGEEMTCRFISIARHQPHQNFRFRPEILVQTHKKMARGHAIGADASHNAVQIYCTNA